MTIKLSERDEEFIQTMAGYVEKTPDVVVGGIIDFFIRKGLAFAELAEVLGDSRYPHTMNSP